MEQLGRAPCIEARLGAHGRHGLGDLVKIARNVAPRVDRAAQRLVGEIGAVGVEAQIEVHIVLSSAQRRGGDGVGQTLEIEGALDGPLHEHVAAVAIIAPPA